MGFKRYNYLNNIDIGWILHLNVLFQVRKVNTDEKKYIISVDEYQLVREKYYSKTHERKKNVTINE